LWLIESPSVPADGDKIEGPGSGTQLDRAAAPTRAGVSKHRRIRVGGTLAG